MPIIARTLLLVAVSSVSPAPTTGIAFAAPMARARPMTKASRLRSVRTRMSSGRSSCPAPAIQVPLFGQASLPPFGQQGRQIADLAVPGHGRRQDPVAAEHPGIHLAIRADSSFASSTPTTDGQAVYVSFWDGKDILVTAYDVQGEKLWSKNLGPFNSQHGRRPRRSCTRTGSSSPTTWTGRISPPRSRMRDRPCWSRSTSGPDELVWRRRARPSVLATPHPSCCKGRAERARAGRHQHHRGHRLQPHVRHKAVGSEELAGERRQGPPADDCHARSAGRRLVRVQRRRCRPVRRRSRPA